MEIIVNDSGIKLIKKYERYYLRFMGGQHEEYPCDLLITNREAASVITDNAVMKTVRDKYKKEIPWTLSYFVEEAIKDYMYYACGATKKKSQRGWKSLTGTKILKWSFMKQ